MARPREFNIDTALDGATREFWKKGFHGANLPELLDAMGLTRGSFYKAFGSKRDLYLATLEHYAKKFIAPAVKHLSDKASANGRQRIVSHFNSLVRPTDHITYRTGCYMCKASVDMAPHDKDVERAIKKMVYSLENAFEVALADTKTAAPDIKPHARKLTATFLGLQVLRNAGADRAMIRDAITSNLAKIV